MTTFNGVTSTQLKHALQVSALADALGGRFEFQQRPSALAYANLYQGCSPLEVTDDTQMTLFGFEAVLSPQFSLHRVWRAYRRWFNTQQREKPRPGSQGLAALPHMYKVKAPGNTCLGSLSRSQPATGSQRNDSNGCGTVMRQLPFMIFPSPEQAISAALLTHQGTQIVQATTQLFMAHKVYAGGGSVPGYEGVPLKSLFADGGWQAQSCVDIALWAMENGGGDLYKTLALATLHSGDSDSTAAVAGACWGLKYGAPPADLLERVVERPALKLVEVLLQGAAQA